MKKIIEKRIVFRRRATHLKSTIHVSVMTIQKFNEFLKYIKKRKRNIFIQAKMILKLIMPPPRLAFYAKKERKTGVATSGKNKIKTTALQWTTVLFRLKLKILIFFSHTTKGLNLNNLFCLERINFCMIRTKKTYLMNTIWKKIN